MTQLPGIVFLNLEFRVKPLIPSMYSSSGATKKSTTCHPTIKKFMLNHIIVCIQVLFINRPPNCSIAFHQIMCKNRIALIAFIRVENVKTKNQQKRET